MPLYSEKLSKMVHAIVVMGVTGSGKSTIGLDLAHALNWEFYDADNFHPEENVTKMSNGIPLTDEDRVPWLKCLATLIRSAKEEGENLVLACSALRHSYRDLLKGNVDSICFVYLSGDMELISNRMRARSDHFMPTTLLSSQFALLEIPSEEEAVHVDISPAPDNIIKDILEKFQFSFSSNQKSLESLT